MSSSDICRSLLTLSDSSQTKIWIISKKKALKQTQWISFRGLPLIGFQITVTLIYCSNNLAPPLTFSLGLFSSQNPKILHIFHECFQIPAATSLFWSNLPFTCLYICIWLTARVLWIGPKPAGEFYWIKLVNLIFWEHVPLGYFLLYVLY